jgi:hypothetical protein
MRMLNARASRSLLLVLQVIPAVVVALCMAWSGPHWAVLTALAARFVMMVVLVIAPWLVSGNSRRLERSRQSSETNGAGHGH